MSIAGDRYEIVIGDRARRGPSDEQNTVAPAGEHRIGTPESLPNRPAREVRTEIADSIKATRPGSTQYRLTLFAQRMPAEL